MGYVWIIVPILPILAAIALSSAIIGIVVSSIPNLQQASSAAPMIAQVAALYTLVLIMICAVLIANDLALYFLLDRRNRHFKRQQVLFAAIPTYLLAMKNQTSNEKIARLLEISDDSIFEEQDRPAGLWAILALLAMPIVGLVIAYDLTQDMQKHEERQAAYQQTLPMAFEEAGIAHSAVTSSKLHNRDPIFCLVLTAITAGLFWIYWFYALLKDYNEHFTEQASLEDQILSSLRPVIACSTCGGSIPQNTKFCPLCGIAQLGGREIIDRP
jgi:phosphate/sulfate permease